MVDQSETIKELEGSGQYKVIRKYKKPDFYCQDDGSEKLKGIFLDVETTGLSHEIDKIIEIALVPFEFSKDGRIFDVDTIEKFVKSSDLIIAHNASFDRNFVDEEVFFF
jgi:DNA polymerase III subunit epsilon